MFHWQSSGAPSPTSCRTDQWLEEGFTKATAVVSEFRPGDDGRPPSLDVLLESGAFSALEDACLACAGLAAVHASIERDDDVLTQEDLEQLALHSERRWQLGAPPATRCPPRRPW